MMKYNNTYRIDSSRIKNWDYGSHGSYFVTICTKNKECHFGNIAVNVETHDDASTNESIPVETHNYASLQPTEIGNTAYRYWAEIPNHFPFVELDEFIIMPNHVHGILFFNKPDYQNWKPNSFGPQSKNLASIIRSYKGAVKKYATIHNIDFEWQPRYYDHVIQSEHSLNTIRDYVRDNPIKWLTENESIVETHNYASLHFKEVD